MSNLGNQVLGDIILGASEESGITAGYGNAQADIKQVYYKHGQAQASIAARYFVHGQAQARIGTVNAWGQAQGWIKKTYPFCTGTAGDGSGAILGTDTAVLGSMVLGSSEVGGNQVCEGAFGQAQAFIQRDKFAHGQAQADIKATSNQHGQAQTDIKQTYFQHGQAQALIGVVNFAHGQAQAKINAFGVNVHGQAQADIKQTYNQHGQAQGTIVNTYYAHGQSQAQIKNTYNQHGQCQALITAGTVNAHGQAQATIYPQYIHFLDTFTRNADPVSFTASLNPPDVNVYYASSSVSPAGAIDGSKVIISSTQTGNNTIFLKSATDITGEYTMSMDFRASNYISTSNFYFELSIGNPNIGNGFVALYTDAGNVYLDAGNNSVNTPFVPGNGFTYRFRIWASPTNVKAKVFLLNDGITTYPEPIAWTLETTLDVPFTAIQPIFYIELTDTTSGKSLWADNLSIYAPEPPAFLGFGQARAFIHRTIYHGQARAWIKKEGQPRHGQAQARIRLPAGFGQAQARIKTEGVNKHGQAQATIINTKAFAQAQAFITNTTPNGQAQGYILNTWFPTGQARAHILNKNWVFGQAQAQITAFGFNVSGQAQGLITGAVKNVYAQTMARIKVTNNAYGQAQASIAVKSAGQAQALIKTTSRGHGQASAYIIRRMGFGQAQGYVRKGTETRVHGQAQGYIEYQQYGWGQVQAMIRKGAGHGQAQARIRSFGQVASGNSQAFIRRTDTRFGSGQSAGQIKRNDFTGQAQALIEGGRYLVKYNGYHLPGYAQVEDYESTTGIYDDAVTYQDGPFSEYVGLKNKTIQVDMVVVGETYLDVKNQVQEAATIARSSKSWTKLYIQRYDRYCTAINEVIRTNKAVGSSMRMLNYELIFEAKPWLESDTVYTISGGGTVSAIRDLYNGGWTPTKVKVSGTNVTISGYTNTGEFTGYISISGTVTDMVIDSESYTSSNEEQMYNPDYALFVGPGTTTFEINGATNCEIQYRDRWYL